MVKGKDEGKEEKEGKEGRGMVGPEGGLTEKA